MDNVIWHSANIKDVLQRLGTGERGLSNEESAKRLTEYGPNELKSGEKISPLRIFLEQFNSFLIWILMGAAIISFSYKDHVEGIVILSILILNAALGFIQEYNAEKSLEALRKLAAVKTTVLRSGKETVIDVRDVVPGDLVLLEEGAKVPADCRILESNNLAAQEAALTGESNSVSKDTKPVPSDAILAEMSDMVFSGTVITRGRAKAIAVETGQATQIGRIAKLLGEVEDKETPLQKSMEKLGKQLGIIALALCGVLLVYGYFFQGLDSSKEIHELIENTVSLAVAAIPEGLVAVVTISLALGVKRMVRKNALIRKLSSVETLGCTTIICTDKTGTLTHNEMTVRRIFVDGKDLEVTGQGYEPKGTFLLKGREMMDSSLSLILKIGASCNNSRLDGDKVIGDPTEAALVVSAGKAGIDKDALQREEPRADEILFDSSRKCMSTIHKSGKGTVIYTKGAPEVVLSACDKVLAGGKIRKITSRDRALILEKNKDYSSQALRVLGFAFAKNRKTESNLVFVGLQAMIDPPRSEAKDAIAKCRIAGIRVIMITGDNELTAKAIAAELGIEGNSMTGKSLDQGDISLIVKDTNIFARVNPEHKMKIVEALQKEGHVVAMTGDGVNDAPAIKKADIGIAMGITGTDVAKESSKMILLDDNFVSIVNAVEEGRGIYDNIRKFVYYLLSCNMGEFVTIFAAVVIFGAWPLAALQILWMNLITDGFPALALGIDPIDTRIMSKKPRKSDEHIITGKSISRMASMAAVMTAVSLILFSRYLSHGWEYAGTIVFTALVLMQLLLALTTRSEQSIFTKDIFRNRYLLAAVGFSFVLQLAVMYTPMAGIFHTLPLTLNDWLIVAMASSSIIVVDEIRKHTIGRIEG